MFSKLRLLFEQASNYRCSNNGKTAISLKYVDPQGGIYAIAMDNIIMIKRLQAIYPAKKIRIISDSPKYEPLEAEPEQVIINGKVIWFGREIER